jgi:hypothetical protein
VSLVAGQWVYFADLNDYRGKGQIIRFDIFEDNSVSDMKRAFVYWPSMQVPGQRIFLIAERVRSLFPATYPPPDGGWREKFDEIATAAGGRPTVKVAP